MESSQAGAIASEFLTNWFEFVDRGYLQLTFIRDGRVSTSCYAIAEGYQLAVEEAIRRNANGDNCYLRVAPVSRLPPPGDRGDESFVSCSPGMWAEVDVYEAGGHKQAGAIAPTFDAARAWIASLPIKPSTIIHSGGGFHLYWRATEPRDFGAGDWMEGKRDASLFEAMLQKSARAFGFGLDSNITRNFACLLRLPGLINWKREGGHVVTVESDKNIRYDWSTFEEVVDLVLAGESPDKYLYTGASGAPSAPGDVTGPRGRNDSLKAMTAACLAAGKDVSVTAREIVAFDLRAHDKPLFLDPSEPYSKTNDPYINAIGFVTSIMQSIQRQAEGSGRVPDFGNAESLRALSHDAGVVGSPFSNIKTMSFADAWEDRTPYEPHLIQSLLPKGTLSVIAGPPKSQKSLMLLDLACKMAIGEPWFGFAPLRPLRVFLIQFEMSADMMRSRIHNFRQTTGYSPTEKDRLSRNFIYTEKCVAPFNRDTFPHYLNFAQASYPDKGAPPDVLVFDPLQNMYDGNENSNAEMFVFLRLLDEFRDLINPDAGIIILHHANKTNRREMIEDPFNALRGASALRGYYTSAIFISKISEDTDDRMVFFDTRAGMAPGPKRVEYRDGDFVDVGKDHEIEAGETQLQAWNAEGRRQRNRILLEINERARRGELYAPKQLAEVLSAETDLPGPRRIQVLLSEYATRGYVRFTDGAELGLRALDSRSHGYVVTELTELADEYGELMPCTPTHYKDKTNGYLVELESEVLATRWHYDDNEFEIGSVDPDSNILPFRGRKV